MLEYSKYPISKLEGILGCLLKIIKKFSIWNNHENLNGIKWKFYKKYWNLITYIEL
jgi:hypothetical protein